MRIEVKSLNAYRGEVLRREWKTYLYTCDRCKTSAFANNDSLPTNWSVWWDACSEIGRKLHYCPTCTHGLDTTGKKPAKDPG